MKIIDLNENEIDYVEGMNVRLENGIYYLMNQQEVDDCKPSLAVLKLQKIQELEKSYKDAQWIRVKNGHIFMIPLSGDGFKEVERQANAATINLSASLRWQDIDGNIQTLNNIPLVEWKKFFDPAKTISFSNFDLKEDKIIEIKSCLSELELNSVNFIFPPIQEVVLDI